jgi:hypothetical protein
MSENIAAMNHKHRAGVARYAHMSTEHLQPYADKLGFEPDLDRVRVRRAEGGYDTKSPTKLTESELRLVA